MTGCEMPISPDSASLHPGYKLILRAALTGKIDFDSFP